MLGYELSGVEDEPLFDIPVSDPADIADRASARRLEYFLGSFG
jgi:hypothetical protein